MGIASSAKGLERQLDIKMAVVKMSDVLLGGLCGKALMPKAQNAAMPNRLKSLFLEYAF